MKNIILFWSNVTSFTHMFFFKRKCESEFGCEKGLRNSMKGRLDGRLRLDLTPKTALYLTLLIYTLEILYD